MFFCIVGGIFRIVGGISLQAPAPVQAEAWTSEGGPLPDEIPDQEVEKLVTRLQEKYPIFSRDVIRKRVERSIARRSRASIFYMPSESQHLWTPSKVFGWHIIEVNTKHSFYEKVIFPLQKSANAGTLVAIELFIIAAVIEEGNKIQDEDGSKALANFRLAIALKLGNLIDAMPTLQASEDLVVNDD